MSRSESWKMWAAVIAILIFSGLITAVWPLITSLGGSSGGSVPVESETVVLTPPPLPFLANVEPITVPSFILFLIIGVLVIGAVVVTGLIIGGINLLLSKLSTSALNSESYQEGSAALEEREKEQLATKREGRAAATEQQRDYSRWAVVATSLAILMFAVFLGYLFTSTLFPSGEIFTQEQIINIAGIVIAAFFLVTLFILLLRMNPRRLAAIDQTDFSGIPWDAIVVILLGVLVLGLGIGLIVFLNRPV